MGKERNKMSKAEIIKRLKELVEGDNLNNYWLKEKIEEILEEVELDT